MSAMNLASEPMTMRVFRFQMPSTMASAAFPGACEAVLPSAAPAISAVRDRPGATRGSEPKVDSLPPRETARSIRHHWPHTASPMRLLSVLFTPCWQCGPSRFVAAPRLACLL